MRRMTLGSLFSGSGGFELAGLMNGIEPKWLAEIEPYPCRVTAARFPGVPNHGDVTKIDGAKIEPVDIITFGSPCQDLSVAGKQAGIHEGQRSNLFFEAIRIIKEMRDATANKYPRFAVWENVLGACSSHKGEDFRAVLEAFCEVGEERRISVPEPEEGKWKPVGCIVGNGWSLAWRLYDAQWTGVPQRRKRIYLIADFGSERAGEILLKFESMCGNPAAGGETREGTAGDAEGSAGGSDQVKCLNPWDPEGKRIFRTDGAMQTLFAGEGGHLRGVCYSIEGNDAKQSEEVCPSLNTQDRHAVAFMVGQGANARSIAWKCPTLRAAEGGSNQVYDVVYGISRSALKGGEGSNGGMPIEEGISPTIVAQGTGAVAYNVSDKAMTLRAQEHGHQPVVCYDARGNGDGEVVPTLTGDHENRVTDYTAIANYIQPAFGEFKQDDKSQTLKASDGKRVDPGAVVLDEVKENATTRNKVLQVLREAFGAEAVQQWRTGMLELLQQESLLQQGVHEECVSEQAENWNELECYSQLCKGNQGRRLLRNLRESRKDRCASHGQEPDEQFSRESAAPLQELSSEAAQEAEHMLDMWGAGEGARLLQQALYSVQEVRQPVSNGLPEGERRNYTRKYIVRRLSPLECCRLQGFPDWWCDGVEGSDTAQYKMWGNGIAIPCAYDVLRRITCADRSEG